MMTVGAIMLEVENLSDEELVNLKQDICALEKDRKYTKQEEALKRLRNALDEVISLEIDIYDIEGGNLIRGFDDLEFNY